jgi:hypothetical protein
LHVKDEGEGNRTRRRSACDTAGKSSPHSHTAIDRSDVMSRTTDSTRDVGGKRATVRTRATTLLRTTKKKNKKIQNVLFS